MLPDLHVNHAFVSLFHIQVKKQPRRWKGGRNWYFLNFDACQVMGSLTHSPTHPGAHPPANALTHPPTLHSLTIPWLHHLLATCLLHCALVLTSLTRFLPHSLLASLIQLLIRIHLITHPHPLFACLLQHWLACSCMHAQTLICMLSCPCPSRLFLSLDLYKLWVHAGVSGPLEPG